MVQCLCFAAKGGRLLYIEKDAVTEVVHRAADNGVLQSGHCIPFLLLPLLTKALVLLLFYRLGASEALALTREARYEIRCLSRVNWKSSQTIHKLK